MAPRIVSDHIIFNTRSPEQIRGIFPHAKINGTLAGVELTLDNATVLRNMGIAAPSPIRKNYRWKGTFTPLPHQVVTSELCTLNKRMFVLNDMGSMKTISSLWAADYLMEQGVVKKVLIVTPLSTLERVWGDEIFKHFHKRKFAVLFGSAQKRKDLLASDVDFYIINHHGIEVIKDELKKRTDINLYILDEGAIYRNSQNKMWKTMKSMITPDLWVWLMTGSPTPNAPTDAFGQMKLIKPENYPGSFTRFKDDVMQQVGVYRWLPRIGWEVLVNKILQPSIRYELADCVNLPPTIYQDRVATLSAEQRVHFTKLSREAVTIINGSDVSAVNAGVLLSKLVQTACIAVDTRVLSSRGWVPIQEIQLTDLVWDGVEWVTHEGVVYKGDQQVIDCGGITLTPDHEMLTTAGWQAAGDINGKSGEGFKWAEVWSPTCYQQSRVERKETDMCSMAVPLRLWSRSGPQEPEPEIEAQAQRETLWVPSGGTRRDPRHDPHEAVQHLGTDAGAVLKCSEQGLAQLWRQGHSCLQKLAKVLRELLGRYARGVCPSPDTRPPRQQRSLLPEELSLANGETAVQQQMVQRNGGHPQGPHDSDTGSGSLWIAGNHTAREDLQIQMGVNQGTRNPSSTEPAPQQVYDIINCGPRSRFVVRGSAGELRIVHNCGVVYGADGTCLRIDFGPRLEVLEGIIEECREKIIIFVPLTGILHALADELKKKWTVEMVDGSTSAGKRNKIFQDFQCGTDPRIVIANPQTMSHGLTLTAATTIIWYAPIHSNEYYEQANARIARPGQTKTTNIVHIYATPVERRIYDTLKAKGAMQQIVLDLARGGK